MIIGDVEISAFLKATAKFKQFCEEIVTEKDKAAVIQAFEYSYEVAWKTMRKLLLSRGLQDLSSPREVFRAAARGGLIDNPELWFGFIKLRNLTVHTYNEGAAHEVVQSLDKFSEELDKLLSVFMGLAKNDPN
jgi:nucleotidyltransferase substrate binding protein (TIGR01987 family)